MPSHHTTPSKQAVPDIITPNLDVLFCGINPGLYSAQTGYHFARPGNRFWPALHASGFTPTFFHPSQQHQLLELGIGITNFVTRPSTAASELLVQEIEYGTQELIAKVKHYQPKLLAILGISTYRQGFHLKTKSLTPGPQPHTIGHTQIWLLPNPSGLNAHYTQANFNQLFTELHQQVKKE